MRHTKQRDEGFDQLTVAAVSERPGRRRRDCLDDLGRDRIDFRALGGTETRQLLVKPLYLGTPDLLEAYLQSPSRSLSAHVPSLEANRVPSGRACISRENASKLRTCGPGR